MSSVLACYFGGFAAGVRWMAGRGLPVIWLAAPLWVTLEWLRSWFFIGFPWADLGYTQYRYHDLVQMAEVTGVYGVSAFLVLFNAIAAATVTERGERARRLVPALVVLSVLVVALPAAGRWRVATLSGRAPAGRLTVGITQGNVDQERKWDPAFQGETMLRYDRLTRSLAESHPALILWPETATPFFFQEPGPLRQAVLDLARDTGAYLLIGSPAYYQASSGALEELNRAYLVSPGGYEVATYDKMELVPFGEYVPYESVLFFVSRIVVAVGRIVPGVKPTVFQLPEARFGALICYEGIFPALTRRFIDGSGEFLVNITNDAWYGHTSAPHQLLGQVTFRAIENRVPLVRAANTGISAVIDFDGRIRWRSQMFEQTAHAEEISWLGVRTIYTRFGDVFAWACVLVTVAAFAYGASRRRRARS